MIPDLGKYAAAVGWSYVASLALLAATLALTLWRSRKVKAALHMIEERQKNG